MHQITHIHFDLTTPEGLKITLRCDKKKKEKKEKGKNRKIHELSKKELALLIVFSCSGEKKKTYKQGAISSTLKFINPGILVHIVIQDWG